MSAPPPAAPDGNPQKAHYERVAARYEAHYFDRSSMAYRNAFLYPALWGGLDLAGKRVAELACGAGHNSEALRAAFPTVRLEGFDISPTACAHYAARVGAPVHEVDLTRPMAPVEPFDAAFIVGGLHHCIVDLPTTLRNIATLLKPGGIFMMMEPNRRFFLEAARQLWYRLDRAFDGPNEAALDHDAIAALGAEWFRPLRVTYFGGPAFFIVLNSMILRIPLAIKPAITPPLMALERAWNRIPSPRLQNVFAAQWLRLG